MVKCSAPEEGVSVSATPSSFSLQELVAALNVLASNQIPCAKCRAHGAILPSTPNLATQVTALPGEAEDPAPSTPAPEVISQASMVPVTPTPTRNRASTVPVALPTPTRSHASTVPVAPPTPTSINLTKRWYVITRGRQVGVFNDWAIVSPLVTSVSNACYSKYNSAAEAQAIYDAAVAAGVVQQLP